MDLEHELDELYGADLAEFTARRDELAKALRTDGRREEADAVKKLRKPTLPAWTVNQLARRNRREVDLLLDAGHRAREAQRAVLGGAEREAYEQAVQNERRALGSLVTSARDLLGDRASAPTIERVSRTLRSAAVTDEGREQLALGRLSAEIEQTGFEAIGDVPVAPRARKKRDTAAAKKRVEQAEKRLHAVRSRLEAAEKALARAQEDVEALRAEAEDAESAVADARRQLG